jgi:hypothetical protein
MIESTALFLGVAYLWCVLRAARTLSALWPLGAAVAGSLAAVVKPTTWIAFAALTGIVIAGQGLRAWRAGRYREDLIRTGVTVALWLLLPLVVLAAWTTHANSLKSLNPIGALLRTTEPGFVHFHYGPWAQRLSAEPWSILIHRTVPDLVGRLPALILPSLAIVVCPRRWRWQVLSMTAFFLPFLIFMNLHVVHNYYSYANGLFLVLAVAWAMEGLLEGGWGQRHLAYGLLVGCTAIAILGYYRPDRQLEFPSYSGGDFKGYYREQVTNDTGAMLLGAAVAAGTPSDSVIVGVGLDWSSEVPFYADRRALMIPNWTARDLDTMIMRNALEHLHGENIGGLLSCPAVSQEVHFVAELLERLGLDPTPTSAQWCSLFTLPARQATPSTGGTGEATAGACWLREGVAAGLSGDGWGS